MEYILKRTKRKTIAIVIKDGAVHVHAPLKVATAQINEFVNNNLDWIEKKLREEQSKTLHSDILSLDKILILGQMVDVIYSDTRGCTLVDKKLQVCNKYDKKNQIIKWYKENANSYLQKKLADISNSINLSYHKFDLTSARTKWGSCDTKNNILLNFRLIALPHHLIEYVIIHELCHTIHHDHSQNFWSLVSLHCPSYKKYRNELKKHSQINKIY